MRSVRKIEPKNYLSGTGFSLYIFFQRIFFYVFPVFSSSKCNITIKMNNKREWMIECMWFENIHVFHNSNKMNKALESV